MKKGIKCLIIGISAVLVTCVIAHSAVAKSQNLTHYYRASDYKANYYDIYVGKIAIFPDASLVNSDAAFEYKYIERFGDVKECECESFLKCKYNEEDYTSELSKLNQLNGKIGGLSVVYSYEEFEKQFTGSECPHFNYPVASITYRDYNGVPDNHYHLCYALLTGDNEIVYVYYTDTIEPENSLIPSSYLPVYENAD